MVGQPFGNRVRSAFDFPRCQQLRRSRDHRGFVVIECEQNAIGRQLPLDEHGIATHGGPAHAPVRIIGQPQRQSGQRFGRFGLLALPRAECERN